MVVALGINSVLATLVPVALVAFLPHYLLLVGLRILNSLGDCRGRI